MKQIIFIVCAVTLTACANTSKQTDKSELQAMHATLELERQRHAVAMEELRNAQQLAPPEMPQSSLLVPRVCVSEPIFDVYGRYVRTSTRCQ